MITVLLIIGLVIGAASGIAKHNAARGGAGRGGWVYFTSAKEGPVKIGTSKDEPRMSQGVQEMSPFPLRILWKLHVKDRKSTEGFLHDHLAEWRLHGDWYDRDAALAFLSSLKDEDRFLRSG